MFYKEILQKVPFDQFIDCYWVLQSHGISNANFERVIPDAQMEMIFHCKDPYRCKTHESDKIQPRSFLFGQLDQAIELMPSGQSE